MLPSPVKKQTKYDLHVVPRIERDQHLYEGADCPCEPRCVFRENGTKIFVHQTHLIDILVCRPAPPPNETPDPAPGGYI